MNKTSICLSMIVKNEAHVIARCLRSVKPLISSWVIVDTGSTDDTERVVREELAGIPGEFVSRPWVDFATNRNQALELSRARADYSLIIDADDELELAPGFLLPELTLDGYRIMLMSTISSLRLQLLKSSTAWRYVGAVHEVAQAPQPATEGVLEGVVYKVHLWEGGRSRDPNKYLRDAEMLEKELARDPNNARNVFYLAQSYKDHGDLPRAIEIYRRRIAMGGNNVEEMFMSLYSLAWCLVQAGTAVPDVILAYLQAHSSYPTRAESLCTLATFCRTRDEPGLAHAFATAAISIPRPKAERVAEEVYAWTALEEYALGCWALGFVADARRTDERIVKDGVAPPLTLAAARHRLGLPAEDPRFAACVGLEP